MEEEEEEEKERVEGEVGGGLMVTEVEGGRWLGRCEGVDVKGRCFVGSGVFFSSGMIKSMMKKSS